MINSFFLVGTIKNIDVNEPKDTKKSASAVLLIQYGPPRDTTNNAVEFINAVLVRIPSYSYPKLKDKLEVGAKVCIHGHLQGVYKHVLENSIITTELVVDRITNEDSAV